MISRGNLIILEDAKSFYPIATGIDYTDISGAKFHIPMKLLIRLYEGAKYDATQKNVNWDQFCAELFQEKNGEL